MRLSLLLLLAGLVYPQAREIEALHVQGNVYLLSGAGGNIALQTGPAGTLLVDAGGAESAERLLAAIRKVSNKPLRYLINTNVRPDRTGGNEALAKAGNFGGVRNIRGTPGESLTQMLQILAHDNVMQRMAAPGPADPKLPEVSQPTETWIGTRKDMFYNGESIAIQHLPRAATDGDSLVYFRKSDVIVAGDILNMNGYPLIDLAKGGTVQGVIDGLNRVLELAIPAHHEEGGTYIIPGQGRVCDQFDVTEYRDMVTILRDRIQLAAKQGKTLEQIQALRLTRDYDPRFGTAAGATNTFVEAVFETLKK